jgi:curved DNA-binding protein CbpA/DNA-directed RNA polymerase subunit RPC12/RpoP
MNNIRFACQKCGQRLACEPPSLGTQIPCPACKQRILVPTVEILGCYQLFELGPRASFDEVKQAHLERVKAWHPDQFAKDPESTRRAAEKTGELNRALETITAYLRGTYTESRTSARAKEETRPEQENKQRSAAEKRPEPKAAQPAASYASAGARIPVTRSRVRWILVAAGVTLAIALIVGLVIGFLQRQGTPLTDESTGTQWTQAKERAKRAYCRAILIEMEQKGMFRKSSLRVNDDFFYDGLEAIFRQQNPEDLNSKLVDVSAKLIGGQR